MRVYGPWSFQIAAGGASELTVPDTWAWKGSGIISRASLKETDLSLNAISKKYGFSQPNHLCALFKQQFGMTMSDFLNRNKVALH